jgi:hypothetical protein
MQEEQGSGPEVDVAVGAGGEEPRLGRVPHQVHHAEVVVHGVTPASRRKFNILQSWRVVRYVCSFEDIVQPDG